MTQAVPTLTADEFLWALGSLCQLRRIPFEPALVLQQCPPPYDRAALLGADGAGETSRLYNDSAIEPKGCGYAGSTGRSGAQGLPSFTGLSEGFGKLGCRRHGFDREPG